MQKIHVSCILTLWSWALDWSSLHCFSMNLYPKPTRSGYLVDSRISRLLGSVASSITWELVIDAGSWHHRPLNKTLWSPRINSLWRFRSLLAFRPDLSSNSFSEFISYFLISWKHTVSDTQFEGKEYIIMIHNIFLIVHSSVQVVISTSYTSMCILSHPSWSSWPWLC